MSKTGGHDNFEERLGRVGRRGLPAGWREEILGNACGAVERGGVIVRVWETIPKAVAVPVAACWVAILVLRATTPSGDVRVVEGEAREEISEEVAREMFVSWVARKRGLAGGLDVIERDEKL